MKLNSLMLSLRTPLFLAAILISSVSENTYAADLVGDWHFDEGAYSRGKFSDRTGMGGDAKLVYLESREVPEFLPDAIGSVRHPLRFDGSRSHWLEIPCQVLDASPDLALEFWFKWDGTGGKEQFIVGNASGLILGLKEKGKLYSMVRVRSGDRERWVYVDTPGRVEAGVWQHAMLSIHDGNVQLVRVPARQSDAVLIGAKPRALNGDLVIQWQGTAVGINPHGKSSPFSGSIAGFKIYDGALDTETFLMSEI
ncbi:LamG-like jellyroll fold domain-containing protein [Coraliomargarita algicola]|uniref:LamG-like jellyroll fold domain-containing protein n=1 Tax=Coraliomargarita algicola TaxID=3092156 RepID=A0ABZ0RKQ6_9BACT|nr:LamG-like jellyroll fold domain-containing protein [Coraliomargarita sp. J2-16]WPJ96647.1 LamG-like jellyroll fold domain-containing protein [Coraliomargarita sp. J2-16]